MSISGVNSGEGISPLNPRDSTSSVTSDATRLSENPDHKPKTKTSSWFGDGGSVLLSLCSLGEMVYEAIGGISSIFSSKDADAGSSEGAGGIGLGDVLDIVGSAILLILSALGE